MSSKIFDNPHLPLSEMMRLWPATIQVFMRHRMICVGCLINPFHTVVEACAEYRLDEFEFRAELQAVVDGSVTILAPELPARVDRRP